MPRIKGLGAWDFPMINVICGPYKWIHPSPCPMIFGAQLDAAHGPKNLIQPQPFEKYLNQLGNFAPMRLLYKCKVGFSIPTIHNNGTMH